MPLAGFVNPGAVLRLKTEQMTGVLAGFAKLPAMFKLKTEQMTKVLARVPVV